MVEIDFKQIEEFDDQNLFWTFLLPSKNNTRYVEFLQNGNAGFLNLCEVEIYGTKEAISNIASFEVSGYKRLVDVEFWPGRYCYHTSYGEKPFWQVDLGDIFIIYLIRIYQWGTLISE
ncbi:uncharacterized protein LOC132739166 [Ruditapes philippinarum]|uniref:uncharacterized protein LOC132739166 n=1 Tax=Ruditapes philippinarum TaxID=129788 RepID=UPI00295C37AA|nr:uncharacterized protein LOC132739166 [Ruditapes philippinarum]